MMKTYLCFTQKYSRMQVERSTSSKVDRTPCEPSQKQKPPVVVATGGFAYFFLQSIATAIRRFSTEKTALSV